MNNKKKIILLIPAWSVVSGQMVQLQNQRSQLLYIEYVGIADIVTRIDGGKKRKEKFVENYFFPNKVVVRVRRILQIALRYRN